MLVLSRKVDERIILDGGRIAITVCHIDGDRVRIGVQAPREVEVHREEIQRLRDQQSVKRTRLGG